MTRYRLRFSRQGKVRYLSAHDTATILERSVRRAKLPMAYSQGFSPHPKISFATALPVGFASTAELLDITLTEELEPAELQERFNKGLPEGFRIEGAAIADDQALKLGKVAAAADYLLRHKADWLPDALRSFMALDTYEFVRQFKGSERVDDLRPGVLSAESEGDTIEMRCLLDPKATRPTDVVVACAQLAGREVPHAYVERTQLLTRSGPPRRDAGLDGPPRRDAGLDGPPRRDAGLDGPPRRDAGLGGDLLLPIDETGVRQVVTR